MGHQISQMILSMPILTIKLIKDLLVSKDKELSPYKSSSTSSSFE